MKIRSLLLISCTAIPAMLILAVVSFAHWERKQTPFQNSPKLISALHAFSRDQTAAGRQLPPEIPLGDLLRGGYLNTEDVHAFDGMEVTFSSHADESDPQMILARARTADGQVICLLADGSVGQFSQSRYDEMVRNTGLRGSSPTDGQPMSSETNSIPSAAGSRRQQSH